MSRQHDRADLPPEVRIRMAEDDLDRADARFDDTVGKIQHARGNLELLVKANEQHIDNLAAEVKTLAKETVAKIDEVEHRASEEIAGNRKVMVGVLISTLSVAIAIVAQVLIMRGGS